MDELPFPPATKQDLFLLERRITVAMAQHSAASKWEILAELKDLLRAAMENAGLTRADIQTVVSVLGDHEKRLKLLEARYVSPEQ